ncbi:MAG: sigma-54 dependent transcriptional regulator [Thermoanaerobaculia bacterium]
MSVPAPSILVADDQPDILESMRLLLKGEGYSVELSSSPEEAMDAAGERDFDAALIDLNYTRDTTSGREGLDLLAQLRELDSSRPVVVMTAWGSIELAVEAMRLGASDFFEKPWDNERVLAILRNQIELRKARRKGERLEAENRLLRGGDEIDFIADSRAMRPVLELIERVGPSDANVLITGENGTGKGIVAQLLHSVSDRADMPLVTVNTGGLSESIFESELFGHVKGAFTDAKGDRLGRFEMADGGTLFLDEIGNLPAAQQAKLLRVVETGEFERVGASRTQSADVRVLSATNADLEAAVGEGRFRKDLLYRLRTVEIRIPPLRERGEDLEPLANHFFDKHAAKYRKRLDGFDESARTAMRKHGWPGNVRELDHAVERGVLMAQGPLIATGDLGLESGVEAAAQLEKMTLEDAERLLIQKALDKAQGNVSLAAEDLGLSRSALYRRLEKHGLN